MVVLTGATTPPQAVRWLAAAFHAADGDNDMTEPRRTRTHNGVRRDRPRPDQGVASAGNPPQLRDLVHLRDGLQPLAQPEDQRDAARNGTLDEADVEHIYATYLSPTRLTDRIDRVGNQVMDEIEQVMAMIDAAAGTANTYSESLAGVSATARRRQDREGLRAIVEGLVQTANDMENDNQSSRSGSRPQSRRSTSFRRISKRCATRA